MDREHVFKASGDRPRQALPLHTMLDDHYEVGRVLGVGGFALTYLAWDVRLLQPVAVKEFLPRELAGRAGDRSTVHPHTAEDGEAFEYGLEQFLQEARLLARFSHPHIVRVRDFFEAYGTACLVMDYYQGRTLTEELRRSLGRLDEEDAVPLVLKLLDGLETVHAEGILHRDLKPSNVYLTDEGRPVLLDFGAARQAMSARSRTISQVLTPGYAPFEQYHGRGDQGPWTDVYATAATLYHLVTGQPPTDAAARMHEDTLPRADTLITQVSPGLADALQHGLALAPQDRPQSAEAFAELLRQAQRGERVVVPERIQPAAPAAPAPSGDAPPTRASGPPAAPDRTSARPSAPRSADEGQRFGTKAVVGVLVGTLVAAVLVAFLLRPDREGPERVPRPRTVAVADTVSEADSLYADSLLAVGADSADVKDSLRARREAAAEQEDAPRITEAQRRADAQLPRASVEFIGLPSERGRYAEAVQQYRAAADRGAANAQSSLAYLYEQGYGVERDRDLARRLYRQAADQGDAGGQAGLAEMTARTNTDEAIRLWRLAAQQEHPRALHQLGLAYQHGRGVERDPDLAARLIRQAAEQGYLPAQHSLGYLFREGVGVERDYDAALIWTRQAAEAGYAAAQADLGIMYRDGLGTERDVEQARQWLQRAADQGNMYARTVLARL